MVFAAEPILPFFFLTHFFLWHCYTCGSFAVALLVNDELMEPNATWSAVKKNADGSKGGQLAARNSLASPLSELLLCNTTSAKRIRQTQLNKGKGYSNWQRANRPTDGWTDWIRRPPLPFLTGYVVASTKYAGFERPSAAFRPPFFTGGVVSWLFSGIFHKSAVSCSCCFLAFLVWMMHCV